MLAALSALLGFLLIRLPRIGAGGIKFPLRFRLYASNPQHLAKISGNITSATLNDRPQARRHRSKKTYSETHEEKHNTCDSSCPAPPLPARILSARILSARILSARILSARILSARILSARILSARILLVHSRFGPRLHSALALAAFGSLPALAQNAPAPATQATPPGPATQPPPPPGTAPACADPAARRPGPPPGTTTAPGAPAPAAPAPAPINYNVQYNGLIDGYYLFNFRNPKNVSAGAGEPYYDDRHNSPAAVFGRAERLQDRPARRPSGSRQRLSPATPPTSTISTLRAQATASAKPATRMSSSFTAPTPSAATARGLTSASSTPRSATKSPSPTATTIIRALTAYNYVPFYHAGARIYTPLPGLAALTADVLPGQRSLQHADNGRPERLQAPRLHRSAQLHRPERQVHADL